MIYLFCAFMTLCLICAVILYCCVVVGARSDKVFELAVEVTDVSEAGAE